MNEKNNNESEEILTVSEFSNEEKLSLIEALIFASGDLLPVNRISETTGIKSEELNVLLEQLMAKFEESSFGIELVKIGSKYQFRTKEGFAQWVSKLKSSRPRRLSPAALETLAVIAYRQPVVKSDIEKIRGVDATPTLKTLVERGLIKIIGYQATVGQPALYGTTEQFMKVFGLESLKELPALKDVKQLEEDPGEPGQIFSNLENNTQGSYEIPDEINEEAVEEATESAEMSFENQAA